MVVKGSSSGSKKPTCSSVGEGVADVNNIDRIVSDIANLKVGDLCALGESLCSKVGFPGGFQDVIRVFLSSRSSSHETTDDFVKNNKVDGSSLFDFKILEAEGSTMERLEVVKLIKNSAKNTGVGASIMKAKNALENVPFVLASGITSEEIDDLKEKFSKLKVKIVVEPHVSV